VQEEQEHESIEGEKARCFFVVRGWEGMEDFERSVQMEGFKEGIEILLGWKAPFERVCFLLILTLGKGMVANECSGMLSGKWLRVFRSLYGVQLERNLY